MACSESLLINDRCLYRGNTGVTVYLRNLLAHWPADSFLKPVGLCTSYLRFVPRRQRLNHRNSPIALRPLKELGVPGCLARMPSWIRRKVQQVYASLLGREFRTGKYAIHFEPNHLAVPCGGLTISTVHDLSVLEHPEWHPADRTAQWQAELQESLAATRYWIAVSQFTRDRMNQLLGIPRELIKVIPLAARPLSYPHPLELPHLKRARCLPSEYLLHVGDLQPRKNLKVILDAYAALPQALRNRCRLILAGPAGWGERSFWRSLIEHPIADEVLVTGFVSDADVGLLLAGATALLAPSHYEGFGLPLLEAMACGTPVIRSAVAAFDEVAGSAAVALDGQDTDGWRAAMQTAIEDGEWRADLAVRGRRRATQFSWDITARCHADFFAEKVSPESAETMPDPSRYTDVPLPQAVA